MEKTTPSSRKTGEKQKNQKMGLDNPPVRRYNAFKFKTV